MKKFKLFCNGTVVHHCYGRNLKEAIDFFNDYSLSLVNIDVYLDAAGRYTNGDKHYTVGEFDVGS